MSEKPIAFSPVMIPPLRAGIKTQTRRALGLGDAPAYEVGDVLWVREEHWKWGHWEPVAGAATKSGRQKWLFVADHDQPVFNTPESTIRRIGDPEPGWHKRLARFMFRKDCRMLLRVTEVREHKLHDISVADCLAEGVMLVNGRYEVPGVAVHREPQGAYFALLDFLHGEGFSARNPRVAAYTFEEAWRL